MDNNNLTPENNNTNVEGNFEVFSMNENTNTNVQGSNPNLQEITPQPVAPPQPVIEEIKPQVAETPNPSVEQVQPQAPETPSPNVEQVQPQAPVALNPGLEQAQSQAQSAAPSMQTNVSVQSPVQDPMVSQPTMTNTLPNAGVNTQKTNKHSALPLILVLLAVIGGFAYYFIGVKGLGKSIGLGGTTTKVINDADITGYACTNGECNFSVLSDGKEVEYLFKADNQELFERLSSYEDYIKVNINVSITDDEGTIVGYEIYNKKTEEKIENVTNEAELRTALNLHNEGTYTETMTFVSMEETPGISISDENAYSFYNCVFKDSKGNELDMSYVGDGSGTRPELVSNQTYSVTFTVEKSTFDYSYKISSVS